jgi:hypothetical protein
MGFGQRTCCVIYNVPHCTVNGALCPSTISINGVNNTVTSLCNVMVGNNAGLSQTTGNGRNVLIGVNAARGNTTGDYAVVIGHNNCFGSSNFIGTGQTIVGWHAACGTLSGFCNTLIGALAGASLCGSSTHNTFIGACTGVSVSAYLQCGNTFIGMRAGCSVTTGICNTIIGVEPLSMGGNSQWLIISAGFVDATSCPTVYIAANTNGFSIGCPTPVSGAKLYVAGCAVATIDVVAFYSDRRLKENIIVIDCAIDKIKKISGVSYKTNDLGKKLGFESDDIQYGFLADEVEKVLPEVVVPAPFDLDEHGESKSGEDYKTVKYEKIIPLLIQGIKELNTRVENMQEKLNKKGLII